MRCLILACVVGAVTLSADEATPPPAWAGEVGASYVATSGNTDTSTLGTSGALAWQVRKFKFSAQTAFVRTENNQSVTSKRVDGILRAQRNLPARLGAYAQGSYYRDLFAGVRDQEILEAGGMYRFLQGNRRELVFSLSLAQTWEERTADPDRAFFGARPGLNFHIAFNSAVSLEQTVGYTHDFSDAQNWRGQAATKLTSTLGRIWAIEAAYKFYYTRKPSKNVVRLDTATMISLVAHWPQTGP